MFYLIFCIAREYLIYIFHTIKVFFTGENVLEEPELEISTNLTSG